jgi:hypothetical protein
MLQFFIFELTVHIIIAGMAVYSIKVSNGNDFEYSPISFLNMSNDDGPENQRNKFMMQFVFVFYICFFPAI